MSININNDVYVSAFVVFVSISNETNEQWVLIKSSNHITFWSCEYSIELFSYILDRYWKAQWLSFVVIEKFYYCM